MKKNEMKINNENIKITLQNDILNRKRLLIQLIKLLNCLEDNYIISLDGDWGVGKTFFIKQLLYLYDCENINEYIDEKNVDNVNKFKETYVPIYYNAWENDNHDDVIESIIYNILDIFPKYKKDLSKKRQDFEEIVKPFLMNIIEKGSLGIISKETLKNIKSFDDLAKNVITTEEKKNNLYEIFNLLTDNSIRILLIIDELDRCRPDYAIKVLETIKHFFDYDKITTFVVTNNRQLSECIKHFYGYNFNGYEYLNKMYDTVLSLDVGNLDDYITDYLELPNTGNLSEEILYSLIKYLKFSLRECNSFVSMYKISLRYINLTSEFRENSFIIQSNIFLPLGLALKVKNIKNFKDYIDGNADAFVMNFIKYLKTEEKGEKYTSWLMSIFKVEDSTRLEEKIIEFYHEVFKIKKRSFYEYPMIESLTLIGNLSEYKKNSDEKK